jgi:hypothetical protein
VHRAACSRRHASDARQRATSRLATRVLHHSLCRRRTQSILHHNGPRCACFLPPSPTLPVPSHPIPSPSHPVPVPSHPTPSHRSPRSLPCGSPRARAVALFLARVLKGTPIASAPSPRRTERYPTGTQGVLQGYSRVLQGTPGVLKGDYQKGLQGYSRGTPGVLQGYSRGTTKRDSRGTQGLLKGYSRGTTKRDSRGAFRGTPGVLLWFRGTPGVLQGYSRGTNSAACRNHGIKPSDVTAGEGRSTWHYGESRSRASDTVRQRPASDGRLCVCVRARACVCVCV